MTMRKFDVTGIWHISPHDGNMTKRTDTSGNSRLIMDEAEVYKQLSDLLKRRQTVNEAIEGMRGVLQTDGVEVDPEPDEEELPTGADWQPELSGDALATLGNSNVERFNDLNEAWYINKVPSRSRSGQFHYVVVWFDAEVNTACTCEDWTYRTDDELERGYVCKHIREVYSQAYNPFRTRATRPRWHLHLTTYVNRTVDEQVVGL